MTLAIKAPCPLCGCKITVGVKIRLNNKDYGDCWGHYRGCAACEWASSMHVAQDSLKEFPQDGYERLN